MFICFSIIYIEYNKFLTNYQYSKRKKDIVFDATIKRLNLLVGCSLTIFKYWPNLISTETQRLDICPIFFKFKYAQHLYLTQISRFLSLFIKEKGRCKTFILQRPPVHATLTKLNLLSFKHPLLYSKSGSVYWIYYQLVHNSSILLVVPYAPHSDPPQFPVPTISQETCHVLYIKMLPVSFFFWQSS